MKILITGCYGLIGSKLTNLLKLNGHEVVGIDIGRNYLKFSKPSLSSELLYKYDNYRKDLIGDTNVYAIDVKNGFEILDCLKNEMPDIVIHLAALPLANLSFAVSQEAYTSIFGSTFNLMESIRILGSKIKLVFASSSMVYGNFLAKEAYETDTPAPISNYGAAKLAGETLIRGFSISHEISSIIIRPSAVYGPGDQNGRVLQKFIGAAFNNETAFVSGKDLVLDFTYIDDICQGFIKASEKLHNEKKHIFEIINCTSGSPVSLAFAIDKIKDVFPKLNVKYKNKDERVPKRGGLNLDKAKKLLNFTPTYSFEKGLEKYIKIERELRRNV